MKRMIFFLSVMATAVSCEYKLDTPKVPETEQTGTFELSAEMTASPDFVWERGASIGVYGSLEGSNARFVLYSGCEDKSGEVNFYGPQVSGDLFAYYPYRPEGIPAVAAGRIPYFSVQEFRPDADAHLAANSVCVAGAAEGKFSFRTYCGLVGFELDPAAFGTIRKLVLKSETDWLCGNFSPEEDAEESVTEGGKAVELVGIVSGQEPFDAFFVLHEGEYDGLKLEIHTDLQIITAAVVSSVNVTVGSVAEADVTVETYEGAGSDLEVIPGEKYD